jgi:hypothetical protein
VSCYVYVAAGRAKTRCVRAGRDRLLVVGDTGVGVIEINRIARNGVVVISIIALVKDMKISGKKDGDGGGAFSGISISGSSPGRSTICATLKTVKKWCMKSEMVEGIMSMPNYATAPATGHRGLARIMQHRLADVV